MYLHCFPSSFCSLAFPQPPNRCRRHRLTDLVDIDLPTSTTSIWRLWKCSDRGCGKADLEAASFQPLVSCLSSHAFTTSSMVMPKRRRRRRNSGNSCLRNSCLRAMRILWRAPGVLGSSVAAGCFKWIVEPAMLAKKKDDGCGQCREWATLCCGQYHRCQQYADLPKWSRGEHRYSTHHQCTCRMFSRTSG